MSEPDAVPAGATPAASAVVAAEVNALHATARLIAIGLAVATVVTFAAGFNLLHAAEVERHLIGVGLVGFAGSGVGALTSLLGRYAAGFELESGVVVPPDAEGETYNRRIAFCFVMRPVLGFLVAPLIVGGIALFYKDHADFKGNYDLVTIIAFIGGLYAKSALEAAKSAFKVVFRA